MKHWPPEFPSRSRVRRFFFFSLLAFPGNVSGRRAVSAKFIFARRARDGFEITGKEARILCLRPLGEKVFPFARPIAQTFSPRYCKCNFGDISRCQTFTVSDTFQHARKLRGRVCWSLLSLHRARSIIAASFEKTRICSFRRKLHSRAWKFCEMRWQKKEPRESREFVSSKSSFSTRAEFEDFVVEAVFNETCSKPLFPLKWHLERKNILLYAVVPLLNVLKHCSLNTFKLFHF